MKIYVCEMKIFDNDIYLIEILHGNPAYRMFLYFKYMSDSLRKNSTLKDLMIYNMYVTFTT